MRLGQGHVFESGDEVRVRLSKKGCGSNRQCVSWFSDEDEVCLAAVPGRLAGPRPVWHEHCTTGRE